MADPSSLDFLRIPAGTLIALDWRPYHFAIQPYHYVVRMIHILSMATFFGGIAALDVRLMGWWSTVSLRTFADHMIPWLYFTFSVATVTGFALFFFDPVHVGSQAYFTLKLVLIALGVVNAVLFRRSGYLVALEADAKASMHPTSYARLISAVSLVLWTGVIVCSCLNVEGVPKVFLR
jgi:hypothetical protein